MGGVTGLYDSHSYTAAKGAVVNLTRSLAISYIGEGMRTNCVCPGFVDTPMIAPVMSAFDNPDGGEIPDPDRAGSSAGRDCDGKPVLRQRRQFVLQRLGARRRRRLHGPWLPGLKRPPCQQQSPCQQESANHELVKSADQVAQIQDALHNPRFVNAEMLTVDFLTDPAWVAHVLPPPLKAGGQPRVTAMVGRWRSNCVGDFAGGALYIEARFREIVGDYVLSMWMDGDQPTIYGRDVFGEPKKLAASRLHRSGNQMSGRISATGQLSSRSPRTSASTTVRAGSPA